MLFLLIITCVIVQTREFPVSSSHNTADEVETIEWNEVTFTDSGYLGWSDFLQYRINWGLVDRFVIGYAVNYWIIVVVEDTEDIGKVVVDNGIKPDI